MLPTNIAIAQFKDELSYIKIFWENLGKAAFCRIEGGIHRKLRLSDHGIYDDVLIEPLTFIERLNIPELKLEKIKKQYLNLQPGELMIIMDSDSNDLNNRIGEPIII